MAKKICLNMIVKNESHVIARCLASVKPLIDSWVIVDTGSTDNTQQIIQRAMQGLPGQLFARKWVDFAHNRNEALALAQRRGDYLLFLDADELLVQEPGFRWPHLTKNCYQVPVKVEGGLSAMRPLLVSTRYAWRWEGVLHEEIVNTNCPWDPATLPGLHIAAVQDGARSHDPQKYLKDAHLLEEALKNEPTNTRYATFLALSYEQAGRLDLALAAHERRFAMGGWDEERFYALLRIGCIHMLSKSPSHTILEALTRAHLFRPSRIEPLCYLALHYKEQGQILAAYSLSQLTLSMPPTNDRTLVDTSLYETKRHLLLSECAHELYKKREGALC